MLIPVALAVFGLSDIAPPEREAAVIAACKAWGSERGANSPSVHRVEDDGLCFRGSTTDGNSAAFVDALAETNPQTSLVIVVNSGGGEVHAAMAMAEAMVPRRTTVVADRQCISSCANYLFLAGDRRVIGQGALLAFHGGMFRAPESYWTNLRDEWSKTMNPTDLEASMTASRTYASSGLERQDAFLRSVSVDPELFEWMESINAMTAEDKAALCPVPSAQIIVFSEAVLAEKGILISQNDGPKSDEELAAELGRSAGMACYWD